MSRRGTSALASTLVFVLAGCGGHDRPVLSRASTDVERGRAALERFECGACHLIPGIRGAESFVGPPLDGFGRRVQLAGRFANTPEVLVRWLVDPPAMKADTAMPAVGVSERDARDIAAYLYTLE